MLNINDFSMDFFSLKGKNAIVTGGSRWYRIFNCRGFCKKMAVMLSLLDQMKKS